MRPSDRKYTAAHEWISIDGDVAKIGITDFAVDKLCNGNEGDLVYCDLPELGRFIEAGETFGEIESVKAVSDLNSPIAGEIIEINPEVEERLQTLFTDPWKLGWMIKVKFTDATLIEGMMDSAAYEEHVSAE